jgi:DNA-binding NarL/FixJ family response regulator
MHELFLKTQKESLQTDSSDYLKLNNFSIKVQVVVPDEIEQMGIEQLLKSRGAKVLSFSDSIASSGNSEKSQINSKADVIILAAETSQQMSNDMPRLISITAEAAPNSKILAISTFGMEKEIALALAEFSTASYSVICRADRIDSAALLQNIRSLVIEEDEIVEVQSMRMPAGHLVKTAERISSLTRRELQILEIVAMGYSNKQIASKLSLSSRTVNNHVGMIFLKLGVNSDSEINGRVSATLAFCIFSRVMVKSPSSHQLSISRSSGSPSDIKVFASE